MIWSVHHNKQWPDFLDFYMEVGDPPTPGHWLTGRIPGTRPSPGNIAWVPGTRLEKIQLNELTDLEPMIFDDELKRLAIAAYAERQENPATELLHLNTIETEHKALLEGSQDLSELQIQLERMSQEYLAALKKEREAQLAYKGRGSQVRVGRAFRHKLVPILSLRLKELHQSALQQRSGRHHSVVKPLMEKIDSDYDVVAHITLTCILDAVGRGVSMSTPLTKALQEIGERVDHEAFLRLVKERDPSGWEKVDRWVLRKEAKGYNSKIKASKGLTALAAEYEFIEAEDAVKFGSWCWVALLTVTKWFDQVLWFSGHGKQRRSQYYVGLSEEGVKYRDLIQVSADEACFEAWPMLVPPGEWDLDNAIRGGYLTPHPGQVSRLIHNNKGSVPSAEVINSLHKAQSVAFKINPFIYEVQKQLLGKSEEIGSFRTYERDSWEDQNKPKINPAVWEVKYDENRNELPEHKKARKALNAYYAEQKVAEKTRKSPIRVLRVAARFRHAERFYLPCYLDSRLRLYYSVDTVTPNGADWQKALLLAADGAEVTKENFETVRRNLLITLANTWANKEDGVKTDKFTLDGRVEFGESFVKELEVVARDPLSTAARVLWTTASEPFQFLACVREYFEVCVWKTKSYTHLFNGRDATNSGTQILGSLALDTRAMWYTNVYETPLPQDLYGEVAKEAQALLHSEVWVSRKIAKYTKQTRKKMKKRAEEGKMVHLIDYDEFRLTIDPADVDRSILKRAVMCTSYGASWQSKNEYISEELDEAFKGTGHEPTLVDKRLVTDASIEGLVSAFPITSELNNWFRAVGKAAMANGLEYVSWYTPTGSYIHQEYREPLLKQVRTHAMGGQGYRKLTENSHQLSVQTGWGDVKENKAGTALGANFTHSLDADILHSAISHFKGSFFTVHDCGYFLATDVDTNVGHLRDSFFRVVAHPCMESLVDTNELEVDLPVKGDGNLAECGTPQYIFS